jgi:hypothetical protein
MSNKLRISQYIAVLGLAAMLATPAAAGLFKNSAKGNLSPLELTLSLGSAKLKPGEPVICELTLLNPSDSTQTILALDHQSVSFAFQPRRKGEFKEMQFMEPVYTNQEQIGEEAIVLPHASLKRRFLLTTITFQRGDFALQAVYAGSNGSPNKPALKTYSRPVYFTVEGEQVYVHRYLNGLTTKEDAIKLAKSKVKCDVKESDIIQVTDDYGFLMWWVNLRLAGTTPPESVKSYFIDPYKAKVWKEAKPFTKDDKPKEIQIPKDSKILQKFRERQGMGAE